MRPYRIRLAIDVLARTQGQALGQALLLRGELEESRPWIREVLLDDVEERQCIHPKEGE